MDERQKIEHRLRKKEQEIQILEEKIKAAKVYVKALCDVLKMLDKGPDTGAAESILRHGSAVAQARDVIMERETPIHINDLLAALGREQTREARASLASSLAAYVRRNEISSRIAPNTFGLIELGHDSEEQIKPEPPSGFGGLRRTNPLPQKEISGESAPPSQPLRQLGPNETDDPESAF